MVVGITSRIYEDIYTIRMHIEALAARWSAENIDEDALKALSEVVELQEFYVARGDLCPVWQLDSRFHGIIFDALRFPHLRPHPDKFPSLYPKGPGTIL